MKTTNNVQKAITKSLAVIISLVLISITVNAQDFWRTVMENNSFSQIAMAMTDNSEASSASADATTDMNTYANYEAVEAEADLEVENWMTNDNNFFSTVNVATEAENTLDVENWMTDENFFNGMASYFKVETEESLEVENWMQDTNYFGVLSVEVEEEADAAIEVEGWMTETAIWNM